MAAPSAKTRQRQIKIMPSGGLGDCLLATPFIRHFHQSGRYDKIVCAVPAAAKELFDRNPRIDAVIPCQGRELLLWGAPEIDVDVFTPYARVLPPKNLEEIMDLQSQPLHAANRRDIPIVRQVAAFHGVELADETLEIFTDDEDEEWAEGYVRSIGERPLVLVNRGSQFPEKEYPLPLWQEVVDRIALHVAVIEMADGQDVLRGVRPLPVSSRLRRSAALFRRLDCVATVDSFPGHLAVAVQTPAVVLFGPSNPFTFGHAANTNLRTTECPCCADSSRKKTCPRSRCLEDIPPAAVADAVLEACAKRAGASPAGNPVRERTPQ